MSDASHVTPNPWAQLRQLTQARIALGRAGVSVPTHPQLAFQLAHAQARDAVHTPLDAAALAQSLQSRGYPALLAHSACRDRGQYLQRPDLGRRLDQDSALRLAAHAPSTADLALVIGDGLSARAIELNALPFLDALLARLQPDNWSLAPIVVACQARVALGDEIGSLLRASAVVVMIGERPGLSAPDSMGLYLSWAPRPGLHDAQRNCISNVRPAGMGYQEAAHTLHYLLTQARQRGLSGVALKDESCGEATLAAPAHNFLLPGPGMG
ncbi:MAG: ethanolamine ammonia-lyase subunit EutC [Pseudomonadota bacterium]